MITHSPHFLLARKEPGKGSIKRSNINTPPCLARSRSDQADKAGQVRPAGTAQMGLSMDRSPYSRTGNGERGCWYYLRYFFLFVSLIQFLIILGLVLFMIYGNVHATTESSLRATEIRADSLYSQVVGLSAAHANLSKQLNISTLVKESVMQQLLTTRREMERINASFRQCQGDLVRGGLCALGCSPGHAQILNSMGRNLDSPLPNTHLPSFFLSFEHDLM